VEAVPAADDHALARPAWHAPLRHAQADRASRHEQHGFIEAIEDQAQRQITVVLHALQRVVLAERRHAHSLALRARPSFAVVAIEGGPAQAQDPARGRGIELDRRAHAHHHGRIVADQAEAPQLYVVAEPGDMLAAVVADVEHAEADARKDR